MSDIEETPPKPTSGTSEVRKFWQAVPEEFYSDTFVVVHNLGTRAVHCSCRQKNGRARKVVSTAQDDSIVLLRSAEGYFETGDTVIVIG